jgi:lauroyl/myristoyl acyltransferase
LNIDVKPELPAGNRSPSVGQRWQAKTFHYKDVIAYAGMPAQVFVADVLPESLWPPLARVAPLLRSLRNPDWRRREVARIARYLGQDAQDPAIGGVLDELLAARQLSRWWSLAARRSGGWRPRVRLFGQEEIERALAAGKGALVWVAPFAFAPLAAKAALSDHGADVVHLSRVTHGPAISLWGAHHVNRFYVAAEARFVRERVLIGADGSSTKALLRLARHLAGNGVASIMAGSSADRPLTVSFLNATLRIAPGAPALARRTGAALLPVFTVVQPDGMAAVHVTDAISVASGIDDAARAFASRLESFVLAAPGQFLWGYGMTPA